MKKKDIEKNVVRMGEFLKEVNEVNTRRFKQLVESIELIMKHLGVEIHNTPAKPSELTLIKVNGKNKRIR